MMTKEEKRTIGDLRRMGLSFIKISKITGMNLSTIKSFCKRNGLSTAELEREKNMNLCKMCHKPFEPGTAHRKKEFCCNKCAALFAYYRKKALSQITHNKDVSDE